MKNIAIIPARSGSKGLVDKNIKMMNGKPMLAYSIMAAKESGLFTEIMVSTDSEKYAIIAKEYGANVPYLRGNELSGDSAGSWDVVKDVLLKYADKGEIFDTVCLLQPTSPLRRAKDIVEGYTLLEKRQVEAITSVCEVDHSPLWCMVLPEDSSLSEFRKGLKNVPRQNLAQYYRINGALYIRKILYEQGVPMLLEKEELAYIMDRKYSVDIDTEYDFRYAELLMDDNS